MEKDEKSEESDLLSGWKSIDTEWKRRKAKKEEEEVLSDLDRSLSVNSVNA